jgi:hypothetical protein
MPDNVGYTQGSGTKITTREVNYSGETAQSQVVGIVNFTGTDDAKVANDISDTNPLQVQEANSPTSQLNQIFNLLTSLPSYDGSLDRMRATAILESGTLSTCSAVTTVSTVTTATNLSQLDARNASMLIEAAELSAWAQTVQNYIQ